MLGIDSNFADHRLDHTNVTIQEATNSSSEQGHPETVGESDKEQRKHSSETTKEKNRLTTYSIRQTSPVPVLLSVGSRGDW